MNRIDRVTAILIQLQSKRVVKAQEIAERFGISLRTVYRDLKTLEESGVPIVGEAGIGYSLMSGYRLPPVMFTREEATSLLVAEKIVEKYTDKKNAENYNSALFKVKAVLKEGEKEYLDSLNQSVVILQHSFHAASTADIPSMQTVLQAINEKTSLDIKYQNAYEDTVVSRNIEPLGLFMQNNNWHLIAFCNLKNDYRDFRLDRIKDLNISAQKISREHPSINTYLSEVSKKNHLNKVVIAVDKMVAKYLVTQKYLYGFVSEKENDTRVEMTFLTESLETFARWFLMFGSHATIIEPEIIKEDLKRLISDIYKNI
ncbi:MAG: YafY family transcriptional regulator [Bacteroidia bacterium]|nr:YafY family transcriptional regulator [Bacteroidia bacterium]